jgi:putative endonuclease
MRFYYFKIKIMKDWHLYVLRNPKGILYTGISKDTARRVDEHNSGTGAKFTRGRGPWIMAYSEGPFEHGDALRREIAIKKDSKLKVQLKQIVAPPKSAS